MDQQLIYKKTDLGDEAIQSRAKLSEHELRVILIMVDGKKSVGEIVSKFGNLNSVEHALYRLESENFITPIGGHVSDLELERTNQQVQELFTRSRDSKEGPVIPGVISPPGPDSRPASAVDTASLFRPTATAPSVPRGIAPPASIPNVVIPPIPSDDEVLATKPLSRDLLKAAVEGKPEPQRRPPVESPLAPAPVEAKAAPVSAPVVESAKSIAPVKSAAKAPVLPIIEADPQPSSWDEPDEVATPVPPMLDEDDIRRHADSVPAEEQPDSVVRKEPAVRRPNPFAVNGPATAGGFEKAWDDVAQEKKPPLKVPTMPFQFPRRRRGIGKWILGLALVLMLAPVIAFLAYPFDGHRPALEAMLSEAVGQPVKIGRLGASLSPSPAFVIDRLTIGSDEGIVVREIRASPELWSLLGERTRFSEVAVAGARIPIERLGTVSAAAGAVGSAASIAVRELRFSRITMVAKDLELANYSGRAQLDDSGRLRLLALVNGDGTLEVSVVGDTDGGAQVIAEGTGWKPSPAAPFVFESIQASGTVTGSSFVTDKIEGRLFGGVVKGSLKFAWGDQMALETDVTSEFMNTPVLLTALGVPSVVDGQIDGRVRFSVAAESWGKLIASVPMAGDFLATRGDLKGMDLVEAVRRGSQQEYRGGSTKFDALRGRFAWDGKSLRLSQLELSSGIVSAYGAVKVDQDESLSGDVNLVIKASSSRTREPVRISGSLRDPVLAAGR